MIRFVNGLVDSPPRSSQFLVLSTEILGRCLSGSEQCCYRTFALLNKGKLPLFEEIFILVNELTVEILLCVWDLVIGVILNVLINRRFPRFGFILRRKDS